MKRIYLVKQGRFYSDFSFPMRAFATKKRARQYIAVNGAKPGRGVDKRIFIDNINEIYYKIQEIPFEG